MSIHHFLLPKLVGSRFEDHAIPLEILGDLTVLEGMIIEVAKWRYLVENPDRRRSPRNFSEGISLHLTAVDEGSAIAVIGLALNIGKSNGNLPQARLIKYFEQAKVAIINAIAAVGENKSPTLYLPQRGLAYFDRLGRSLREGEAIEFPTDKPESPARLTKENRLKLLRAAEVEARSEEIHIRGSVHAIDQLAMSFELTLQDGCKIPGSIDQPHYETMLEAFNGFRRGVKVQIDGVGSYNRSDRLQKIESIDRINILDPLDISTQLDALKKLKDGWYDGKGLAPEDDGLEWLAQALNEYDWDNLTLPYIYPVTEGGVRMEWSLGPEDVSLEIDLHNHSGDWHRFNLETDAEEARELNLDDKNEWEWMLERLQVLTGTAG